MDADDFRDDMLSFLFLRYLSDNYETAAKTPGARGSQQRGTSPPAADSEKTTCKVTVIPDLFHGRRPVVPDVFVTGRPSRIPLTHGVSHPSVTR
jgi:hypothetical protein